MALKITTIIKYAIIIFIRSNIDTFIFFFKILVNIYDLIMGITPPFGVIVIITILLFFLMYFITDPFVYVTIILLRIYHLFWNIQIVAINAILQIVYTFVAHGWNESIEFIDSIITAIWAGVCGGAEGFSEIADCTGMDNILISIKLIFQMFSQSTRILLAILAFTFTVFSENFCSDLDCSSICHNLACTNVFEPRYDFYTRVIIEHPDPFNLKTQDYFTYEGIEPAKMFVEISISVIMVIINDVVPNIIQFCVFIYDESQVFLRYIGWIIIHVVAFFSRFLSKFAYIIIRPFKAFIYRQIYGYNNTNLVDPNFYNTTLTEWSTAARFKAMEDIYLADFFGNTTVYLLDDPDLPGNPNTTLIYKKTVLDTEAIMILIMTGPNAIIAIVDKFLCIGFNPFGCIQPIVDFFASLFMPATDCFVAKYLIDHGTYYETAFVIEISTFHMANCLTDDGLPPEGDLDWEILCRDWYDTGYMRYSQCLSPGTGEIYFWDNSDNKPTAEECGVDPSIVNDTIFILDEQCDDKLVTPLCYESKYMPFSDPDATCEYYWTDTPVSIDPEVYPDLTTIIWGGHESYEKYGTTHHMENAGYFNVFDAYVRSMYIITDILLFLGLGDLSVDILSLFNEISIIFWTWVKSSSEICACNVAPIDESQVFLVAIFDFFNLNAYEWLDKLPCNPDHPTNPLCVNHPYYSLFLIVDAVLDSIGLSMFNQSEITMVDVCPECP